MASSADVLQQLLAGGIAGAISRTVVSPLERAKIIYQVSSFLFAPKVEGERSRLATTLHRIWDQEGMKGLLRGNGMNVLRMIPYSAIQFATFEQIKRVGKAYVLDGHRRRPA